MTPTSLTDPAVVAFERATLDPRAFDHRDHLYVAWCYLRALPLEDALARYVRHLRRLTAALGSPEKFHATITWAYLLLLHAAMDRAPDATFAQLLIDHPKLADHRAGALDDHYHRAQLDSPEARRYFVLPTRP